MRVSSRYRPIKRGYIAVISLSFNELRTGWRQVGSSGSCQAHGSPSLADFLRKQRPEAVHRPNGNAGGADTWSKET